MKDYLSLYFVFLIVMMTIPIFIYSIGYIKEYKNEYCIEYFWLIMILFVLSMIGVVLSSNSISFVVFWELMSVSSFLLVIFEYKKRENIKAGIMYFIMTHISGIFVIIMFIVILKYTKSMNFYFIMQNCSNLNNSQKNIILILALLGFGCKAGLVPLHAWLPKAHPCAPSNISALMSGVMLKIALYGFIRVSFMFMNNISVYFGIFIMILGAVTAIFSILNALFQNDIKKLLAYSSVENIGIIFSTLGLSLIMSSYGFKSISVLALTAALFHILNHAAFKSLLFTCAGSVLYATSTKNMDELGGLYNKMKCASICAFIGTASVAVVPPLNGFASEILILENFIQSITLLNQPMVDMIIILCGLLLVFTSGVAIWTFIKSYGITYLGKARTQKAVKVKKLPISMNIGMAILSLYTILLGTFSPFLIKYIYCSMLSLLNINSDNNGIHIGYEITIVSGILILVGLLLYILMKDLSKEKETEVYETWACGFCKGKSYIQYSSSGFTQPAARLIGKIVNYKKEAVIKETILLKQKNEDIVEKNVYTRIIDFIDFIAENIVKIHYGKIQIYISYIFISLIISIIIVLKFV